MGSNLSVLLPVLKANGEVHNTVPRGRSHEDNMKLERVSYVTHPNSQTAWIVEAERLDHHMLTLEFRDYEGLVRYILADKVAAPPEQAGIRILWYTSFENLLSANDLSQTPLTVCKEIHGCFPRGLSLRRVEAILNDCEPSFHVLASNCQHYAQEMWFRLLRELQL